MKKDKIRIAIIAVVLVVAAVAGLLSLKIEPAHPAADVTPTPALTESPVPSQSNSPQVDPVVSPGEQEEIPSQTPDVTPAASPAPEEGAMTTDDPAHTPAEPSSTPVPTPAEPTAAPSPTPSVPPVSPSLTPENPDKLTCFVEIRCDTVMDTSVIENEAVIPYLPQNGVILEETEVEFEEGDSAFDVLSKICRKKDIQMEFRTDGAYSGNYIEGINYLYEFDAGALSGWMYKVNEKFPNYGCSNYKMQKGDKMVWVYTTDLGRDVGDNSEW